MATRPRRTWAGIFLGVGLLVVALASALGIRPALADESAAIKAAIAEIESVETQRDMESAKAAATLARGVARLSDLINRRTLNDTGVIVAHYYRGRARALQNTLRQQAKETVDTALARAALADFDKVIARGVDIPGWNVTVADAAYAAGRVAMNQLKTASAAYAYWDRCARRDHAGCLNIMADVRVTGDHGQRADIREALSLHERVYQTGTRYGCAGAFSAHSIALIVHFTGVKRPSDDELVWFGRAQALLDELETKGAGGTAAECGRGAMDIDEYFVRRGRGERPAALLERARSRAASEPIRLVTSYLVGGLDDERLTRIVVPPVPDETRCQILFWALWNSAIAGRTEWSRAHMRALLDIGNSCGTQLRYARKFGL